MPAIPDPARIPEPGTFAEKRRAFLLMFWARFYYEVPRDELDRPGWYLTWTVDRPHRDYYGMALDAATAAFGLEYKRDPETRHFVRDDITWRRMFDALARCVTVELTKRGYVPSEARAKAEARRILKPYVEYDSWEWQIKGMIWGRCHIHDKECVKSGEIFIGELYGIPCCYRFKAAAIAAEIKSGQLVTQPTLF